jgi:hypothetical protein
MRNHAWDKVLGEAQSGDHQVVLYEQERFLYDSTAEFLSAALRNGRHALIVATPAHAAGIRAALEARGNLKGDASDGDRLTFLSARETLSQLLADGWPDPRTVQTLVGDALDRAAARGEGPPAVYGEMVDLLFQAGLRGPAARLEELWTGIGRTRQFSLLCGYRIDFFEPKAGAAIREVACSHSHVVPVQDDEKLEAALDRALAETMGDEGASLRSLLLAYPPPLPPMPPAAAALLWLRDSLPGLADPVLTRVRDLYRNPCEWIARS